MSLMGTLAIAAGAIPAALLTASHLRTRSLARQALDLVPQIGSVQPVTGGAIHYVEHGPEDGQPVVMIHGLSGQLQHFTYAMADDLAQTYRVIALDRPGCGYSVRASDHLAALPEQARMIQELLDQRDIRNPVLVGHSLGGAVALAMALQRPEATRALALIAPLTHPTTDGPEAFKGLQVHSSLMRQLIAQTVAVPMAKRTAADVLGQVFDPEPYPENFLTRGGGALGLRPQAFVTASTDFLASRAGIAAQAAEYAAGLQTAGGVLFGQQDAVLDADAQGSPMQRFGLDYETLDNRGHMLPITAPEACCEFVRRIVSAHASHVESS
jgi:pimeloyl-ACP methyl ester carboxylesterase